MWLVELDERREVCEERGESATGEKARAVENVALQHVAELLPGRSHEGIPEDFELSSDAVGHAARTQLSFDLGLDWPAPSEAVSDLRLCSGFGRRANPCQFLLDVGDRTQRRWRQEVREITAGGHRDQQRAKVMIPP